MKNKRSQSNRRVHRFPSAGYPFLIPLQDAKIPSATKITSTESQSDNRRHLQHREAPAAPKAPVAPMLSVNPDLPGLDAITQKYAAELERGRQISAHFNNLEKDPYAE